MNHELVGLKLSPEIAGLLAENDLDLYSEIAKRVPEVSRPGSDVVIPSGEGGSRSVELLILVSAVAAPLVASAIGQVIESVSARKVNVSSDNSIVPEETRRSLTFSFLGLKVEFVDERKR